MPCPETTDPVCASGITFRNICLAQQAGWQNEQVRQITAVVLGGLYLVQLLCGAFARERKGYFGEGSARLQKESKEGSLYRTYMTALEPFSKKKKQKKK